MRLTEKVGEYIVADLGGGTMRELDSLPSEYPAYVLRMKDSCGIAVPYEGKKVLEYFHNIILRTVDMEIDKDIVTFLVLETTNFNLLNEFSSIAAQFANPGKNGENRKKLLSDPVAWCRNWKDLLGNAIANPPVYAMLGELYVLDYLLKKGLNPKWSAEEYGSHDIQTLDIDFEVKSTKMRHSSEVEIASIFQLISSKTLILCFCRWEKATENGISINKLVKELIDNGFDAIKLENSLKKLGYEEGMSARDETYELLEFKQYLVDDKFPKITQSSFKNNQKPKGVISIKYSIDLDQIDPIREENIRVSNY